MAPRFIRAKFALAILFLGVLFWANMTVMHLGYKWYTTPTYNKPVVQRVAAPVGHCPNVSEQFLIERGIDLFVDKVALGLERSGSPGEDNPYPYLTRKAFVQANPECCSVQKDIPGDFDEGIRPYLRGQSDPYVVAIKMRVIQHYKEDGERKTTKVDRYAFVSCDGVAVNSWEDIE